MILPHVDANLDPNFRRVSRVFKHFFIFCESDTTLHSSAGTICSGHSSWSSEPCNILYGLSSWCIKAWPSAGVSSAGVLWAEHTWSHSNPTCRVWLSATTSSRTSTWHRSKLHDALSLSETRATWAADRFQTWWAAATGLSARSFLCFSSFPF